MNNCYGVKQEVRDADLVRPLISLGILYEGMPATTGCESCQEINGENEHWCCKSQSPSMYYVEFLYVWKEVVKWNFQKKTELILRCVQNYLSDSINKGCVFYVDGCTCYDYRPFVCRMYGVIPSENWDKKWEALKSQQGDDFDASPQCGLVKSDREISAKEENRWFSHTSECESRLGVLQQCIDLHDQQDGSYRSFHDHVLLELFDEDFLSQITKIKVTKPSQNEINDFIMQVKDMLLGTENGTSLPN